MLVAIRDAAVCKLYRMSIVLPQLDAALSTVDVHGNLMNKHSDLGAHGFDTDVHWTCALICRDLQQVVTQQAAFVLQSIWRHRKACKRGAAATAAAASAAAAAATRAFVGSNSMITTA